MKIEKAVKTLTTALKKDVDFRQSYKANIAMAFQDEYQKSGMGTLTNIHKVANNAAENFLDQWINNAS